MTTTNLPAAPKEIEGEVRKANEAIAIRPISGEALTFLTRKLYNTMLFHAQKQGADQRVFEMPLRVITKGSDFESHDIQLIKEHLKKMKRAEVEWNSPGKEWGISSLVSEALIRKVGGELLLRWEYGSSIQGRLLNPLQYTPVALAYQAVMRTHAGLALLEICLRYESFHAGLTERRPWEWWYSVLTGNINVATVAVRKHFYRYFKRDTLKPAMQEVNSLTEFDVELIEHTKGRKVIELQFKVGKRAQKQLDLDTQVIDVSLITRMMSLGLKDADAQKIYSTHEENRIRSALDVTEKKMRSKAKPESAVAYFRSALSAEWLQPATAKQAAQPQVILADEASDPAANRAMVTFEALPIADQKRRLEQFSETLQEPLRSTYAKQGLGSAIIRRSLATWLAKAG